VDLDPGDHTLGLEDLRQRPAVGRALADRLVEQDHAAHVLRGTRGREQHLAIRAATVLRRLAPDGVETLLDRAAALVGRQDALARSHQLAGRLVQCRTHRSSPRLRIVSSGPCSTGASPDREPARDSARITPTRWSPEAWT